MQKQDELGVQFGKYQVFAKLAVGGMAELYLAKQPGIGGFSKTVVLKCILPHLAHDDEFITMFLDEARVVAPLDHPNIIQIHEIGQQADVYFIVMEYIRGQNLKEFRKRLYKNNPKFKPYMVSAGIIAQVAAGLHYAHNAIDDSGQPLEVVHRDISPTNLLIGYNGTVKIVDFGVAKATNQQHKTSAGTIKGKYRYMSPEQIRGHDLDGRSDVFSLGIVLYEMTTNRGLFARRSEMEVIDAVRDARVVPPSKFREDYPEFLEHIVLKALAKDLEERYQSADEMRLDLERFMREEGTHFGTAQISELLQFLFDDEYTGQRSGVMHNPLAPSDLVRFLGELPTTGSFQTAGSGQYTPSKPHLVQSPWSSQARGQAAASGSFGAADEEGGSWTPPQEDDVPTIATSESTPSQPALAEVFLQPLSHNDSSDMLVSTVGGEEELERTVPGVALLQGKGLHPGSFQAQTESFPDEEKVAPSSKGLWLGAVVLLLGALIASVVIWQSRQTQPTTAQIDAPSTRSAPSFAALKVKVLASLEDGNYMKASTQLQRLKTSKAAAKHQHWLAMVQQRINVGGKLDVARQLLRDKSYGSAKRILLEIKPKAPAVLEIDDLLKEIEKATAKKQTKSSAARKVAVVAPRIPEPQPRREAMPPRERPSRRELREQRRLKRKREQERRREERRRERERRERRERERRKRQQKTAPSERRVRPISPRPTPPAKGRLFVNSSPAGARVELDGRLLGYTPLNNRNILPGTYRLRISKTGFFPIVRKVRISSGGSADANVKLNPKAKLAVTPRPSARVTPPSTVKPKPAKSFSTVRLARSQQLRLFIADRRGIGGRVFTSSHRKLCQRVESQVARAMGSRFRVRGVTNAWQRYVRERSRNDTNERRMFYPRGVAYVIYTNLAKGRSLSRVAQLLVSYDKRNRFQRYTNK